MVSYTTIYLLYRYDVNKYKKIRNISFSYQFLYHFLITSIKWNWKGMLEDTGIHFISKWHEYIW